MLFSAATQPAGASPFFIIYPVPARATQHKGEAAPKPSSGGFQTGMAQRNHTSWRLTVTFQDKNRNVVHVAEHDCRHSM
jgi:hypothetical protein